MAAEADTRDFAERTVVGWHLLFALMVAVSAVFLTLNGNAWPGLVLLAALVLGYVALALPGERGQDWRRYAYVALAIVVLALLTWIDQSALVLLFALYPQCFLLLDRRASIVAVVTMTVVWNLELVAADGWSMESWGVHSVTSVGNIVFALVIGLFIDGLVRESRERSRLLAELRAAQDELAAAERDAGAVAERERIARDIHDTLAQGFTSIVMLTQAAEAAASAGDEAVVAARLSQIEATARENLAEARALVGAMSPPALDGTALPDALARLTSRADLGVPVHLQVQGDPRPLSSTSEVAALRATQEAVANAVRHSGAQQVDVVLGYDEDGATITVTDDGTGFDPSAPPTGYGLTGLVARVEEVGGLAAVDSAPGRGTRVRVRVP